MTDFGVTPAGFASKQLPQILQELQDAQRAAIRADLDLGPHTVLGKLNGIMAAALAETWQLAQHTYASAFVDTATGDALRSLVALVGLTPKQAEPSRVILTVTLSPGTRLGIGSIAHTKAPRIRFATTEEVANTTEEQARLDVPASSVDKGPIAAAPAAIRHIESRVSGWLAVTNPEAATPGRLDETDDELRQRYLHSLAAVGSSTESAIRTRLLSLHGVRAVRLFTSLTSDLVPEHAFEAVVDGGDPQQIATVIELHRPVCTATHGSESVQIKIPGDGERLLRYSRPTQIAVSVHYSLVIDHDVFDAHALRVALANYIASVEMGGTVMFYQLVSLAMASPGVRDLIQLPWLIREADKPQRDNIVLDPRSTPILRDMQLSTKTP